MIEYYCLFVVLTILGIDRLDFFHSIPFFSKMIIKHPVICHPLVCSTCALWWSTIVWVCFGLNPWFLIVPFFAPVISKVVDWVMDFTDSLVSYLYNRTV